MGKLRFKDEASKYSRLPKCQDNTSAKPGLRLVPSHKFNISPLHPASRLATHKASSTMPSRSFVSGDCTTTGSSVWGLALTGSLQAPAAN
eukprot:3925303-Amphidinium_carterae.1